MEFDVIGDIHGHADELVLLLQKLGYSKSDKGFSHPERKVLFVGDYIDRGPQIRQTVDIVSTMVHHNNALALMGNHEFNAVLYNIKDSEGKYLRPHSNKNQDQHSQTLLQYRNREKEYYEMIEWFKTLPLYFENDHIRAVHASWDSHIIHELNSYLNENLSLHKNFWNEAGTKSERLYDLIEIVLKGKEVPMPEDTYFRDKEGNKRTNVRIKWWESSQGKSFRDWGIAGMGITLPDEPVPEAFHKMNHYSEADKPVFFGHYWLTGKPKLQRSNICCLDFSVAKGGCLSAYRHSGEKKLLNKNLHWVGEPAD